VGLFYFHRLLEPAGATVEVPSDPDAPNYRELRLRDLRPMTEPVMIVGRIVTAERREVVRKSDGGTRPVLSGLLSDGTATVRYTWWDPPGDEVERGTILRAANVQIREFRGRAELSFNSRTRVVLAEESELPVPRAEDTPLVAVKELRPADDAFQLEVRIEMVRPKTVQVRGNPRQIFEGRMADVSGSVAFTAWTDLGLVAGSAVRIRGGYVREFRGQPQLTLDERCQVETLPSDHLPSVAELGATVTPQTLGGIEAQNGSDRATVRGVAVGLLPPSGLVYRCPHCRRTLSGGLCRLHGSVAGTPDLRTRLVLDDGTSTATVEAGRPPTERLLGRTLDAIVAPSGPAADVVAIEQTLFERTFGTTFIARGRSVRGDFGLTVFADELEVFSADFPAALLRLRNVVARVPP
jgi:replication factor A1